MAFTSFKKDITKIHLKIDKIAKSGKDNFQDYYDYIDDIILKGKYGVLSQVLFIKYDFDVKNTSIDIIKKKSWDKILFNTNSKFQDEVYTLINNNEIYQIGTGFFSGTNSLGTIQEVDYYSQSISGLSYTDSEYQILTGNKKVYLSVDKTGATQTIDFQSWDDTISYDKNLIILYKSAIAYLI